MQVYSMCELLLGERVGAFARHPGYGSVSRTFVGGMGFMTVKGKLTGFVLLVLALALAVTPAAAAGISSINWVPIEDPSGLWWYTYSVSNLLPAEPGNEILAWMMVVVTDQIYGLDLPTGWFSSTTVDASNQAWLVFTAGDPAYSIPGQQTLGGFKLLSNPDPYWTWVPWITLDPSGNALDSGITVGPTAVPEPTSAVGLGLALSFCAAAVRRRFSRRS